MSSTSSYISLLMSLLLSLLLLLLLLLIVIVMPKPLLISSGSYFTEVSSIFSSSIWSICSSFSASEKLCHICFSSIFPNTYNYSLCSSVTRCVGCVFDTVGKDAATGNGLDMSITVTSDLPKAASYYKKAYNYTLFSASYIYCNISSWNIFSY